MADTYDLLSLSEAKSALKIDLTDVRADDLLASAITSISRRIDRYIGPTVTRSVTSEIHDGGYPLVELRYYPVTAVTSIVEYQSTHAVTLTEKTAAVAPTDGWYGERYVPDPSLYSGIIVRTIDDFRTRFWGGVGNVICTYTAGRVASTALVDARIKEATRLALKNWWRMYEQSTAGFDEFDVPSQNFPAYVLPPAVCSLLHDLAQPETGFGGQV